MPLINEPRRPRGELAHPSAHSSAHSSTHPAHRPGEPSEHSEASLTTGHRAAAQLLGLREVALPAAVVAAADLLLDDALRSEDPVTREAAAVTRGRLRAALGQP
ncbi:hypothetical protein ACIA8O_06430 [Kitasatospora sp. NPDC051853]|uniref:hypothetical protein n=1 Tax=Kitasatospora sp. NPDC051853 TaxID=3364058 RepID=UPI0037B8E00E